MDGTSHPDEPIQQPNVKDHNWKKFTIVMNWDSIFRWYIVLCRFVLTGLHSKSFVGGIY